MTLKHTGILKVIWTLKLRGSFENYLQKKINLLGNFVKIIFSEVFIFAVEKCPSFRFYFSDNFSIYKLYIPSWFDFPFVVLVS